MCTRDKITISELSRITGIPISTIRFYLRKGLISLPIKKGKTRDYYNDMHVRQLKKVKQLRKKNKLSIEEIKRDQAVTTGQADSVINQSSVIDRKNDIITAAIDLFRSKEYNSINISDIAQGASISKTTFYKHFSDKKELFYECADRVFYNIDKEFRELLNETNVIKRITLRASLFLKTQQHMIDMLQLVRGTSVDESKNRLKLNQIIANLVGPIANDLDEGIRQDLFKDMNTSIVAHILMGVAEYGIYFFKGKSDSEIDQYIEASIKSIMQGFIQAPDHFTSLQLIKKLLAEEDRSPATIKDEPDRILPFPISDNDTVIASREKRNVIVSAAIDFFINKGLGETTIDDIVNKASIGKGTFYKYFKDKDDLFFQSADLIFYEMYSHVYQEIKDERDMIRRLFKRSVAFFNSYPTWIDMMNLIRHASVGNNQFYKEKFRAVLDQITKPIAHDIKVLQQEGKINKNLDCLGTAYMLMGMTEYAAWLMYNSNYSKEEIYTALQDLINNGLEKK